ncbi:hypothetical protein BMETH_1104_0 [methanotrophic bacterial endosymbiont of Bathymodiolus sp.]|nr:hypothetical protein BMETH_1104_0 [methanotrophic bacterial endosymbiont of Bathymodiolus sp.]
MTWRIYICSAATKTKRCKTVSCCAITGTSRNTLKLPR